MNIIQNIKVAVDAVVFGYSNEAGVSVLLIKRNIEPYKGVWAIPGGLVKNDESLETAVTRELEEESGVKISYLEQLYTFGKPNRDPRNRVISVTYFALVKPSDFQLNADTDASDAQWFSIKDLPPLAFDHDEILKIAIKRLQSKITYEPIGFELLNKKFAFSELEKLYTTLLDRPIDRRNFKKKIKNLDILEELQEKQQMKSAGRPGNLFQFKKERYFELKNKGIVFEI